MPLGNDIVDLLDAPAGKERDGRFLGRVLAAGERAWLAGQTDQARLLWALWSAKESLFKAEKRADPRTVFSPGALALGGEALEALAGSGAVAHARVRVGERSYALRWDFQPGYVHCLATAQGTTACWAVGAREETDSLAARSLAQQLLPRGKDWEITRPVGANGPLPPVAVAEGATIPVSLSHDGRYAAAAAVPQF